MRCIFFILVCGGLFTVSKLQGQAAVDQEARSKAKIETAKPAKAIAAKPVAASKTAAPQWVSYWQQQAMARPQNAQAWLQWGVWTWRSGSPAYGNAQAVKPIYQQASEHITGTGEYLLLQFLQSNKTDSAAIYGALEKMTDKKTVYPFIIHFDIIRNNTAELKKHCLAFNQLQPLVKNSALYRYHYNVLQSAMPNGTIAAAGENDLVPLAMMQMVHGIRTDMTLQYLRPQSLQNAPLHPLYVCLSAGEDLLHANGGQLQFYGLLAKTGPADAAAATRAEALQLDYLQEESYSGQQAQLHNNYLPCLMLAYRHFRAAGNTARAEYYRTIIIKTATEGGRLQAVQAELE